MTQDEHQNRKMIELSSLVPILKELAHDIINRNFEKLISQDQIRQERVDYMIQSLDDYAGTAVDPPDTEIYRAIGQMAQGTLDNFMVNEIPKYEEDYEAYTKQNVDNMVVTTDLPSLYRELYIELFLEPNLTEKKEKHITTSLRVCIDVFLSNDGFSVKATNMYIS
ncbi:MAG: hypothetical protein NW237_14150 [Cyanobacteriota bacterium]|nr:hypothetical protein [Cyanobacteriota bacterium]